jgi:hypothetical protein
MQDWNSRQNPANELPFSIPALNTKIAMTSPGNEDFQLYLKQTGCVQLFDGLIQALAPPSGKSVPVPVAGGAVADPIADISNYLYLNYRTKLGLNPKKAVENQRTLNGKRVVVLADLNPACGAATLQLRIDALRTTIHSLVLLNTKVLLFADFGSPAEPLGVGSTLQSSGGQGQVNSISDSHFANSLDASPHFTPPFVVLGGEQPSPPHGAHSTSGTSPQLQPPQPQTQPGFSPLSRNSLSLAPGGMSATSISGAVRDSNADIKSPSFVMVKEMLSKERLSYRIIRNMSTELARREFPYLTNNELLILPMERVFHQKLDKDSTEGSIGIVLAAGQKPGVLSSQAETESSAGIEVNTSLTVAYALSVFGEALVYADCSAARFSQPAFRSISRSIFDQFAGLACNEELTSLGPILCGKSKGPGKKRALLLGDGPLMEADFSSPGLGFLTSNDGSPEGTTLNRPTALATLAKNPRVVKNLAFLFDTVFLVGRSARKFHTAMAKEKGEGEKRKTTEGNSEDLAISLLLDVARSSQGELEIVLPVDMIASKGPGKKKSVLPLGSALPTPKHQWQDVGPDTTSLFKNRFADVGTLLWVGSAGLATEGTASLIAAAEGCGVTTVLCGESVLSLTQEMSKKNEDTPAAPSSTAQRLAASKAGTLMQKLALSELTSRSLIDPDSLASLLAGKALPIWDPSVQGKD